MADFDIRDLAKGLTQLNKLASSAKVSADTGKYFGDFVKDNDKMIENLLKYQSGTSIGRETLRFYAWVKDRRKKKKTVAATEAYQKMMLAATKKAEKNAQITKKKAALMDKSAKPLLLTYQPSDEKKKAELAAKSAKKQQRRHDSRSPDGRFRKKGARGSFGPDMVFRHTGVMAKQQKRVEDITKRAQIKRQKRVDKREEIKLKLFRGMTKLLKTLKLVTLLGILGKAGLKIGGAALGLAAMAGGLVSTLAGWFWKALKAPFKVAWKFSKWIATQAGAEWGAVKTAFSTGWSAVKSVGASAMEWTKTA